MSSGISLVVTFLWGFFERKNANEWAFAPLHGRHFQTRVIITFFHSQEIWAEIYIHWKFHFVWRWQSRSDGAHAYNVDNMWRFHSNKSSQSSTRVVVLLMKSIKSRDFPRNYSKHTQQSCKYTLWGLVGKMKFVMNFSRLIPITIWALWAAFSDCLHWVNNETMWASHLLSSVVLCRYYRILYFIKNPLWVVLNEIQFSLLWLCARARVSILKAFDLKKREFFIITSHFVPLYLGV